MFRRMGLQTNPGKTKSMVCTLGLIWGKQGAAEYNWKARSEGDTFIERKITRVSCEESGEMMVAASSIFHHT